MDFDFTSVVYTLAVAAYTIYTWSKKGKNKVKKKQPEANVPEARPSGGETGRSQPAFKKTGRSQPTVRETGRTEPAYGAKGNSRKSSGDATPQSAPQFPDWLQEILEESLGTGGEKKGGKPELGRTETASTPGRGTSRSGGNYTNPSPRHRDSQEVLESDNRSLEGYEFENRSLEDLNGTKRRSTEVYDDEAQSMETGRGLAGGKTAGGGYGTRRNADLSPAGSAGFIEGRDGRTNSRQTATGYSNVLQSGEIGSDRAPYLTASDIRRAVIWSEILRQHPEQGAQR